MKVMNVLARANLTLLALLLLHDVDHFANQPPRQLAAQITITGLFGLLSSALVVIVALRRHPLAAPLSVAVGIGNVVGFTAIHLIPRWSVLSDPYSTLDLNPLSWLLVLAPIAMAVFVAFLGMRALLPGGRVGTT